MCIVTRHSTFSYTQLVMEYGCLTPGNTSTRCRQDSPCILTIGPRYEVKWRSPSGTTDRHP